MSEKNTTANIHTMGLLFILVFFLLTVSPSVIFAQTDADGDGVIDSNNIEQSARILNPIEIIYEDAEDEVTTGWDIYDNDPAGAQITNTYDEDRRSHVIEFKGSGLANGYRLRNEYGSRWKNTHHYVVKWSMKFGEDFSIYIDVETTEGAYHLVYQPIDRDRLENDRHIHLGIGSKTIDGQWHTIKRDLQIDIRKAHPTVIITEVNGFLVHGNGRIDDIELSRE